MGKRWRRYRRKSYTNWSQPHTTERSRVTALYGGVDADVREAFFGLSVEILCRVLADYKEMYGARANEYARHVYGEWKSGKVQMSGRVSERLLAIVPRHLDFAAKYDLLEKLCRRRESTRLRVEVSPDMTAKEATGTVLRAIQNTRTTRLPDYIAERLQWLSDNDGQVAQSLLSQVLDREYEFIAVSVRQELQRLLALPFESSGRPIDVQAQREIKLPGAVVQIVLNSFSRWRPRSFTMPNESQNQSAKPPDAGLAPVPSAAPSGQLVPIQNPQNLLEEALKRMAPEKQAEVLSKAADEALRLQVKQKEHDLDLDFVSGKIDQAGRVVGTAQNPNVNVNYETECRSKHGDTRIRVTSRPQQLGTGCLVLLCLGAGIMAAVAWLA